MSCDVGDVTEGLENELPSGAEDIVTVVFIMGGSPGDVSEEPVT